MQASSRSVRRYVTEHMFYKAIMVYNDRFAESSGNIQITTSEARRLNAMFRRDMFRRLSQRGGDDFTTDYLEAATRAIASALASHSSALAENVGVADGLDDDERAALAQAAGDEAVSEFERMSGISATLVRDMASRDEQGSVEEGEEDARYVPISPFDERFMYRETMWDHGAAEGWVRIGDADRHRNGAVRGVALEQLSDMTQTRRLTVYTQTENAEGETYMTRRRGSLSSISDISGLSLIRPYVPAENLASVRAAIEDSWRNLYFSNDATAENDGASLESASADAQRAGMFSRGLLRELAAMGRRYSVNTTRLGQAVAVDEVSGVQVHLLDEPGSGIGFVGRIRDPAYNVSYRLQHAAFSSVGDDGKHHAPPFVSAVELNDPTIARDAFLWACGETVDRDDVGRLGDGRRIVVNTNNTLHGSFQASTGSNNVSVGRDLDENGNRGQEIRLHSTTYKAYQVDYEPFMGGDREYREGRAREFLRGTIGAARDNFSDSVDAEALIVLAQENPEARPDFADGALSEEVMQVREDIWRFMTDTNYALTKPGMDGMPYPDGMARADVAREYMHDMLDWRIGRYEEDTQGRVSGTFSIIGVSAYATAGSPRTTRMSMLHAMRALEMQANDFLKQNIADDGDWCLDRLAYFDESRAVSAADLSDDEFVEYNGIGAADAAFKVRMLREVSDALSSSMMYTDEEHVRIDMETGIIRWQARSATGESVDNGRVGWSDKVYEGQIGPIFTKTERGTYVTHNVASENIEIAPGTRAWAVPTESVDVAGLDVASRLRGRGFEDDLADALRAQVAADARLNKPTFTGRGFPWSLSRMWGAGEWTSYGADELSRMAEKPEYAARLDAAMVERRVADALSRVVVVGRDLSRNAGIIRHVRGSLTDRASMGGLYNDNDGDLYTSMGNPRSGHRDESNWGVLSQATEYFDPNRAASAGSQAHTRFLREGVVLGSNGFERDVDAIEGAPHENAPTPLASREANPFGAYDAWNRRVMEEQNMSDAYGLSEPVGTALISCGGYTSEDGIVVSSRFAEDMQVPDENGVLRSLRVGDKISDQHGNKGVVSLVVDHEWSEDEARSRGLYREWLLFDANPDLRVVMSPYSSISRGNAGTYVEALANGGVQDLWVPDPGDAEADGREVAAGVARISFIAQDKTAEKKTNPDSERKIGWQLNAVLHAIGAEGVLEDGFSSSTRGISSVSELLACASGNVIDDTGIIRPFGEEDVDARRAVDMNAQRIANYVSGKSPSDKGKLVKTFTNNIDAAGGIMPIPFAGVRFPNLGSWTVDVEDLPDAFGGEANDFSSLDVIYDRDGNDTNKRTLKFGGEPLPEIGEEKWAEMWPDLVDEHGVAHNPWGSEHVWAMPVMSGKLREGHVGDGDEMMYHDYTNTYGRIFENCLCLERANTELDKMLDEVVLESGTDASVDEIKSMLFKSRTERDAWFVMRPELKAHIEDSDNTRTGLRAELGAVVGECNRARGSVQASFDYIGREVAASGFSGKWNLAKSQLMTVRQHNAPNVIWSPNPQLPLDEVLVSRHLAEKMKVKDGDMTMVWRDPVLKPGCALGLHVKVTDDIYGVSVNPMLASVIGGDFDGDTVGIAAPKSARAKEALSGPLSVAENMLDFSATPKEVDGVMCYPFKVGTSADTAVGFARQPELKAEFDSLLVEYNKTYQDDENGKGVDGQLARMRLMWRVSDCIGQATRAEFGTSAISFESTDSVLRSFENDVVAPGVKGSVGKLESFARAMGCEIDTEAIDADTGLVDADKPLVVHENRDADGRLISGITWADDCNVMVATTAKQDYTGMAGKEMQHAVAAFAEDPERMLSALLMVEKLYQKTLDWKNEGEVAVREMPYIDALKNALDGRRIDVGSDEKRIRDGHYVEHVPDITMPGCGTGRLDGSDRVTSAQEYAAQIDWCMKALSLDCDRKLIEHISSGMDFSDEAKFGLRTMAQSAPFIARAGFSESMQDWAYACAIGEDVAAGTFARPLMPNAVMNARAAAAAGRDLETAGLDGATQFKDTGHGFERKVRNSDNLMKQSEVKGHRGEALARAYAEGYAPDHESGTFKARDVEARLSAQEQANAVGEAAGVDTGVRQVAVQDAATVEADAAKDASGVATKDASDGEGIPLGNTRSTSVDKTSELE